MAASFSTVASLVNAELNFAATYSSTPSDSRVYTQQIKDLINSTDGMVVEAICSNPTHPRRSGFLTSSTVAHAAAIPTHVGPIEAVIVDGAPAEWWDRGEIVNDISNVLSLTTIPKRYAIDGSNRFYHNGTTATVHYATYTRSAADPPVLQSPDEYTELIVVGACRILATVEGEDPQAAAYWNQLWESGMSAIRESRAPLDFIPYSAFRGMGGQR